jgi:hypothetical protein
MIAFHATRKDKGKLLELICNDDSFASIQLVIKLLDESEEILQYKVGMVHSGYVSKEYFGLISNKAKKWVTEFDGE